jgi:thiamine-phosphate pyrophosphorylase
LLLYYITDRAQFPGDEDSRRRALLDKIAEATACGVDLIQLREKDLPARELESLAQAAVRIVEEKSRPGAQKAPRPRLLINSRTDVAIASRAHGVHLPSDDISPGDVRKVWVRGEGAHVSEDGLPLVTVSCHTAADVRRAASEGADFAVFAPVFEKQDEPGVGLTALHDACGQNIRVLALGGVNLQNSRSCIDAGAAGIAGIRIFQGGDIAEVIRMLRG